MRKVKIKLILSLISLIVSAFIMVTTTYAWFVSNKTITDMNFQILQIDSQINMYVGNDVNNNGIIDYLDDSHSGMYKENKGEGSEASYVSYTKKYYEEKKEFTLIDSKYALAIGSTANMLNDITLTNIAPSKTYTLKYEVINYSSFSNVLSFSFEEGTYTQDELKLFSLFDMRLGTVNAEGKVTYSDGWVSIINKAGETYSFSGYTIGDDIEVTPAGPNASDGRIDLWLQLKMRNDVSYSDITSNSVTLPEFKINLMATLED